MEYLDGQSIHHVIRAARADGGIPHRFALRAASEVLAALSYVHGLADFDGRPLADALMAPTRIYVKSMLALMEQVTVKGMAHITGGGLVENIPRVLKAGFTAELDHRAWPLPPLFAWLQKHGGVADAEMHRVFNCGIGMAVIVSAQDAKQAIGLLSAAGEQVWQIGTVRQSREGEAQTVDV